MNRLAKLKAMMARLKQGFRSMGKNRTRLRGSAVKAEMYQHVARGERQRAIGAARKKYAEANSFYRNKQGGLQGFIGNKVFRPLMMRGALREAKAARSAAWSRYGQRSARLNQHARVISNQNRFKRRVNASVAGAGMFAAGGYAASSRRRQRK